MAKQAHDPGRRKILRRKAALEVGNYRVAGAIARRRPRRQRTEEAE